MSVVCKLCPRTPVGQTFPVRLDPYGRQALRIHTRRPRTRRPKRKTFAPRLVSRRRLRLRRMPRSHRMHGRHEPGLHGLPRRLPGANRLQHSRTGRHFHRSPRPAGRSLRMVDRRLRRCIFSPISCTVYHSKIPIPSRTVPASPRESDLGEWGCSHR